MTFAAETERLELSTQLNCSVKTGSNGNCTLRAVSLNKERKVREIPLACPLSQHASKGKQAGG
jgi:hypothetical protein